MRPLFIALILAGMCGNLVSVHAERVKRKPIAALPAQTQALFDESMRLFEECYDPQAHLIRLPVMSHTNALGTFMVRESSWYALGLLMRDQRDDRARAAVLLETVLKQQYLTPGTKWFGTFKRSPEDPEPAAGTRDFTAFDPNWRQFIGTTFEIILQEYSDRISPELRTQLNHSLDNVVDGELQEHRLPPYYSNIALMQGALLDWVAEHHNRADVKQQAADWTHEVARLFHQHESFSEYNSPTYAGIDLCGLALWRAYGSTPEMRHEGVVMEAALWNNIADFYQPALRNISGPYDRSYGMDMESYVAPTGVWLRSVLDAAHAPLPPISSSTNHVTDVWIAPIVATLGAVIPAQAMAKLKSFGGEHLVTARIDEKRVATAWIGTNAIWGGEATSRSRSVGPASQFHPATVQWRTPTGSIGWVQLASAPPLDVTADRGGLTVETTGDVGFLLHASEMRAEQLTATHWRLPGLSIELSGDADSFVIKPINNDTVYVTYRVTKSLLLSVHSSPDTSN